LVLLEKAANQTNFNPSKIKHFAEYVKFIHYSHSITKSSNRSVSCQNLNEYWWKNVKSIKTFEFYGCIRAFNDLNCNGDTIKINEVKKKTDIKYIGSWFTKNSFKSIGICQ
jgi:hypothetical protein